MCDLSLQDFLVSRREEYVPLRAGLSLLADARARRQQLAAREPVQLSEGYRCTVHIRYELFIIWHIQRVLYRYPSTVDACLCAVEDAAIKLCSRHELSDHESISFELLSCS